jgi:hypothetical protein
MKNGEESTSKHHGMDIIVSRKLEHISWVYHTDMLLRVEGLECNCMERQEI